MIRDMRLMRAWAEVDLDAIARNYRTVRALTSPTARLCCVIKANAYGHGAVTLARFYQKLGADFLAVSNLEEALELRRAALTLPILILGYTPPEAARILAEEKISQCVFSKGYAEALSREATRVGVSVSVHFKVDTGMGRIGFALRTQDRLASCVASLREAARYEGLVREGIFTHFATADEGEKGRAFTEAQLSRFLSLLDALSREGITFAIRHAANSAALLDYPESHLDMVRVGILLYGLYPSEAVIRKADLKEALTLKTVVDLVKEISPEETVSYGRTFTAKKTMRIATLPIGYADGLFRDAGECGLFVTVGGQKAPIVGRICMDQCMIDLTACPGIGEGEEVTVFGPHGESVSALAKDLGTIPYEILCAIGERIPRAYLENGKTVSVFDRILP